MWEIRWRGSKSRQQIDSTREQRLVYTAGTILVERQVTEVIQHHLQVYANTNNVVTSRS
jgi:hypothetical protein